MLAPRTAQPRRSTNPALVLALVAPFSSSSCAGDPESIEDVWANVMAGAEPAAGCLVPWECSAPALSAGTPETPSYDCGGSPYRSLDVERPGVVEIETEGRVGIFVECPTELDQPISVFPEQLAPRTFAQLSPGRYFMVTDGETTLTTRSLDTQMLGTQCEQLPALSLEAGDSGTSWLFHPAESAYFLRLSLPAPKPVSVVVSGTGPVRACRSCELSADCVVVEQGAMLGATSELVLHFPAAVTQSALAELVVLVAPE